MGVGECVFISIALGPGSEDLLISPSPPRCHCEGRKKKTTLVRLTRALDPTSTHIISDTDVILAIHSSSLAWRIPWTEEPGGIQSIGSHRVRHNWSDLACINNTGGEEKGRVGVTIPARLEIPVKSVNLLYWFPSLSYISSPFPSLEISSSLSSRIFHSVVKCVIYFATGPPLLVCLSS